MRGIPFISLLFFLLVLPAVMSSPVVISAPLSCEYKEIVTKNIDVNHTYDYRGKVLGDAPFVTRLISAKENPGGQWAPAIHMHNPLLVPVTLNLSYEGRGAYAGHRAGIPLSIPAEGDAKFEDINMNTMFWDSRIEDVTYVFIDPVGAYVKKDVVETKFEACKLCAGTPCLNNGALCTVPGQCGGGFCVENHCSNTKDCFNNDCQCSPDQVQCRTNDRCVRKASVSIGDTPLCSFEECTTNYLYPSTGRCEKETCGADETRCGDGRCVINSIIDNGQKPYCSENECKSHYTNSKGLCVSKNPFVRFWAWISGA